MAVNNFSLNVILAHVVLHFSGDLFECNALLNSMGNFCRVECCRILNIYKVFEINNILGRIFLHKTCALEGLILENWSCRIGHVNNPELYRNLRLNENGIDTYEYFGMAVNEF